MSVKSLIINPGSTSTKIGVFEDETLLFEETLRHSTEEISQYANIVDQKDFRKKIITDLLESKAFDIKSLNVIVGRGGMLKPIPGGTYAVTEELLEDLWQGYRDYNAEYRQRAEEGLPLTEALMYQNGLRAAEQEIQRETRRLEELQAEEEKKRAARR